MARRSVGDASRAWLWLAHSWAGKVPLKGKVLLLLILALTLGSSLHHHCPSKPLASWRREIKKPTNKNPSQWWVLWSLSSLKEPALVLWEVPVAAHELGQEYAAGGGLSGWDCPLSNNKQLFDRLSYTIKLYGSPLLSNSSSLKVILSDFPNSIHDPFKYQRVHFIEPAQYLFSEDSVGITCQG